MHNIEHNCLLVNNKIEYEAIAILIKYPINVKFNFSSCFLSFAFFIIFVVWRQIFEEPCFHFSSNFQEMLFTP